MDADEYQCATCRGVFTKGWTDEEAEIESKSYFGSLRPEEMSVICDDCFNKIHPDYHPHEVEQAVADTLRVRQPQQE